MKVNVVANRCLQIVFRKKLRKWYYSQLALYSMRKKLYLTNLGSSSSSLYRNKGKKGEKRRYSYFQKRQAVLGTRLIFNLCFALYFSFFIKANPSPTLSRYKPPLPPNVTFLFVLRWAKSTYPETTLKLNSSTVIFDDFAY